MNSKFNLALKNTLVLEPDEVHIWSAYFPDNYKEMDSFISVLSEDEKKKAANFRFLKGQNQYIISRGVLRYLLGAYLRQRPRDIEILYGLWGKPQLLEELSLFFNVSHSKDYVIYALSSKYEIGIDLEYIDSSLDIDTIVCSIITSSQDLDYWRRANDEEKLSSFFKLWVCKEAFLKASGKGWLDRKCNIPGPTIELQKGEKEGDTKKYTLSPYVFEPMPGYVSALVIKDSEGICPSLNLEFMKFNKKLRK
jgi:phosphopantetheinyl transferase